MRIGEIDASLKKNRRRQGGAGQKASQLKKERAELDGVLNYFASIKDGKGDLAFSLESIQNDKNIDRQFDFYEGFSGVLAGLKPGFGKDVSVDRIISELENKFGDLYSNKEYKKIAIEMKAIFDTYQPKVKLTPKMKENAWTEMVTEMEEMKMMNQIN